MATIIDELAAELRRQIQGEIRTDLASRLLYSTDASIYQIEPLGVAFPKNGEELARIVEVCARYRTPVLARGSGSSLAGQAIGPALIVDCTRYLNRITAIDPEQRTVTAEPGVILNALNRAVGRYGLKFGPDPASAERASVGGSIANNATGAHSILYGMAADHLLRAEVTLWDGSAAVFEPVSLEQAQRRAKGDGAEAGLYRAAIGVREDCAESIRERWPRTWRRASGYNLNYLLPWTPSAPPGWEEALPEMPYPPLRAGEFSLAPLLAGSEGTLAVIQKATLRLVPVPAHTVLGVMAFDSIAEACEATPAVLEHRPAAVELIPQMLIRLARSVPAYAGLVSFVNEIPGSDGDPRALLVVEFSGEDPARLREQVRGLAAIRPPLLAETAAARERVWSVRKVGLGLFQSRAGDERSTAFIEDLAVPVERLGHFVREMERILEEHGTTADIYAHASAGCLHIRPLVNLKTGAGVAGLRSMAQAAVALALGLGGAVSGEHGDGLARSEWLEAQFGSQVIEAFRRIKRAADPHNLLNPGKICSPEGGDPPRMDANLRYGEGYRASAWTPVMDFSAQAGLAGAIEQCNGAGVCRKAEGVMCPSFQATQDEMHSTRGRANLLRAMISGRFPDGELAEKTVYEALDLCLACKGCKAECPSAVDVAKLKYEFAQYYYRRHRRRLRDYLFGYIGLWAGLGRWFAPLANAVLRQPAVRGLGERWLGLSRERPLPALARQPFSAWMEGRSRAEKQIGGRMTGEDRFQSPAHSQLDQAYSETQVAEKERVLLLADAFTEYFYPQAGIAAVRALEAAGCEVRVLSTLGAGRTLISKGFLEAAQGHARRLAAEIRRLDPDGKLPVVGVEPSEILTLRDEYLDLLPGDAWVKALAWRAYMIDEFLVRPGTGGVIRIAKLLGVKGQAQGGANGSPAGSAGVGGAAPAGVAPIRNGLPGAGRRVLLHGHCYQKAQPPADDGYPTGVAATRAMLEASGYAVQVIDSGCCGMAGAFGYEAEHYALSMRVGELKLLPAVREAGEDVILAASGVSCQAQIADGAGREARHPVELV